MLLETESATGKQLIQLSLPLWSCFHSFLLSLRGFVSSWSVSLTLPAPVFYYLLLTLETLPANLPPFNYDLRASGFRIREGLLSWSSHLEIFSWLHAVITGFPEPHAPVFISELKALDSYRPHFLHPRHGLHSFLDQMNKSKRSALPPTVGSGKSNKLESHCWVPAWLPDAQHIKPLPVAEVNLHWYGHVPLCSLVFQSS